MDFAKTKFINNIGAEAQSRPKSFIKILEDSIRTGSRCISPDGQSSAFLKRCCGR